MTTLAVCSGCGASVPSRATILNSQGGLTCMGCQAHSEAQIVLRRSVLNSALGAPAIAILGFILFIVPVINIILPGIAGLVGGWYGITNVRLYAELASRRDNHGVDSAMQVFLLLGGIIAILAGLGVIGMQLLVWVGLALS